MEKSVASLAAQLKAKKQPLPPPKQTYRIAVPKQLNGAIKPRKTPKLSITTPSTINEDEEPLPTPTGGIKTQTRNKTDKPALPTPISNVTTPIFIKDGKQKADTPKSNIAKPTLLEAEKPTLHTPISEIATPILLNTEWPVVKTPSSDIATPILLGTEQPALQTPISEVATPTLLGAEWPILQTPESKPGTPRSRKSKQRKPSSQTTEPNSRTTTPRRVRFEKQTPFEEDASPWVPPSKPTFQSKSHRRTVNSLAFHPSSPSLASGSDDSTIKIWDWETGNLETTIPAHKEGVRDLDFGGPKDALWLASGSSDMTIKLWDPAEGYKNIRTLSGHEHAVLSVRFLPLGDSDKVLLASGSADKTIKIWDATTGYCIKALRGHDDWVRAVRPSADGQLLLSCSSDNTARVWDIHSPSPDAIRRSVSHEEVVTCCTFAPAAAHRYILRLAGAKEKPTSPIGYFVTSSRDKTIKIWEGTGKCIATLYGHEDEVNAIEFHADGRYILSAADDKTVRVWDLAYTGDCISVLRGMHNGFVTCLRWAPPRENSFRSSTATQHDKNSEAAHLFATGSMDRKVSIFKS